MAERICRNCFADGNQIVGGFCSVCGWDNTKPQNHNALPYDTVLASRYLIGRAKSMNGEGITYSALDRVSQRVVEIREFFPAAIASRDPTDHSVMPQPGSEALFEQYLSDFIEVSKGVSRLRELSVVQSVTDIFEEGYTAYAVYEHLPSVTLRRYVENAGGKLSWNEALRLFMPVLTALGLMNSLGLSHLGLSPDTLRINREGNMVLTGFSIQAVRRAGSPLQEELYPGCAAIEQYSEKAVCGEVSDVYGFAAALLFALSGQTPDPAPKRAKDQRLMISREIMKTLPPFGVTAIANALQVKQSVRTGTFERFKAELSATSTVTDEIEETDAIRSLPPLEMDLPQNRGLPPVVWLAGSALITFIALIIVASMWLGDRGMSFSDIPKAFQESSSAAGMIEVPNMVNQSYESWEKKVADGEYDFVLKISTREFSNTVSQGNIISQSPFSGEGVEPGGTVLVTVSKGSASRTLPEIKGMSFAELQEILTKDGFVPIKKEEASDDIEPGYVIRYEEHKEGSSLDYGATVTVVVSSGPEGS